MSNNLLKLTIITALAISPCAFADTNQNSGAGNTITTNNGTGNGNTTIDSNNPSLTANGGSAHSSSSSFASANSRNTNLQGQQQSADNNGNAQAVNQNFQRSPVSTAFAAPLVAAEDTCSGSTSVGGQGVGFGLSVGSTWQDADCVRRKDARELNNMGYPTAAIALMCQNENIAEAMQIAGTPCPARKEKHADRRLEEPVDGMPLSREGGTRQYPGQPVRLE